MQEGEAPWPLVSRGKQGVTAGSTDHRLYLSSKTRQWQCVETQSMQIACSCADGGGDAIHAGSQHVLGSLTASMSCSGELPASRGVLY